MGVKKRVRYCMAGRTRKPRFEPALVLSNLRPGKSYHSRLGSSLAIHDFKCKYYTFYCFFFWPSGVKQNLKDENLISASSESGGTYGRDLTAQPLAHRTKTTSISQLSWHFYWWMDRIRIGDYTHEHEQVKNTCTTASTPTLACCEKTVLTGAIGRPLKRALLRRFVQRTIVATAQPLAIWQGPVEGRMSRLNPQMEWNNAN